MVIVNFNRFFMRRRYGLPVLDINALFGMDKFVRILQ